MRRLSIMLATVIFLLGGPFVNAAGGPFDISGFEHRQDGLDRIFTFTLRNDLDRDVLAHGRFIVLSVYDTSPPISLPIENLTVPDGATVDVVVRWENAPLLGQVRALLVLNVGPGMTTVEAFDFWIFPWEAFIILLGALLVGLGAFLAAMRLRARRKRGEAPEGPGPEHAAPLTARKPEKKKPEKKAKSRKKRYPSGMTGYVVEFDDTVVTVANRFGVTWEDVVRANRLKPPYPLKVGEEILIPVHTLRNPEDEDGAH